MSSYMMPYTKNPPCTKECPERDVHCHSYCERYIEWKTEHQERKKSIDKKVNDERDITSLKFEIRYRERKKKHYAKRK